MWVPRRRQDMGHTATSSQYTPWTWKRSTFLSGPTRPTSALCCTATRSRVLSSTASTNVSEADSLLIRPTRGGQAGASSGRGDTVESMLVAGQEDWQRLAVLEVEIASPGPAQGYHEPLDLLRLRLSK